MSARQFMGYPMWSLCRLDEPLFDLIIVAYEKRRTRNAFVPAGMKVGWCIVKPVHSASRMDGDGA